VIPGMRLRISNKADLPMAGQPVGQFGVLSDL